MMKNIIIGSKDGFLIGSVDSDLARAVLQKAADDGCDLNLVNLYDGDDALCVDDIGVDFNSDEVTITDVDEISEKICNIIESLC